MCRAGVQERHESVAVDVDVEAHDILHADVGDRVGGRRPVHRMPPRRLPQRWCHR